MSIPEFIKQSRHNRDLITTMMKHKMSPRISTKVKVLLPLEEKKSKTLFLSRILLSQEYPLKILLWLRNPPVIINYLTFRVQCGPLRPTQESQKGNLKKKGKVSKGGEGRQSSSRIWYALSKNRYFGLPFHGGAFTISSTHTHTRTLALLSEGA